MRILKAAYPEEAAQQNPEFALQARKFAAPRLQHGKKMRESKKEIVSGGKIPIERGFYMPGEYHRQEGCLMIWPERPGSWPNQAKEARKAFADIIRAIAESETVFLAVGKNGADSAEEMLRGIKNVEIFEAETDDAWARDIGPTFLINEKKERSCVNWEFNAWGGDYNGLYASWKKDNAFAVPFAEKMNTEVYDAAPFVLEGGSIHSDGEGTVLVTEACLLSKGRNPELTKEEIEEVLKAYLGARKIIWIPRGIYQDETDEHVDNIAAFIRPGEVVLAWTDNREDPQYELSCADYEVLKNTCDAKGRKIKVHKLPIPDHPICITKEELEGYTFEEGESMREEGERLAASYVNFFFSNDSVILPAFGGENAESDLRAQNIMKKLCPERKIVPIDARAVLVGGGNIHCITQQIPCAEEE